MFSSLPGFSAGGASVLPKEAAEGFLLTCPLACPPAMSAGMSGFAQAAAILVQTAAVSVQAVAILVQDEAIGRYLGLPVEQLCAASMRLGL